ncbi:UTRA domain-containing protein [Lipingzhangella sp. LS1_29]|uniref:UTRA domain-containing protein n=1 Tax=Lipingzhangella rawalii TaxID=2055835 RepID=A0ABU2HC68_9ACTN|nr:UTRA domain-containing protein [Lipingzhangella rawalii]
MRTQYLIRMDGQPVSASLSWEPARITAGTDVEDPHEGPLANTGIVPRMDAIGYRVTDVREDVEGRMPHAEERERLDIAAGVPLIEIQQTFYSGDTPVQAADITIPADRYRLSFRMPVE